ncbi:hypothetical protein nieznany_164 [Escherichia phage nieznany]|uniref:Uncharacterized protein n=1 Tax=Escherichia phage nieznany TaxID=2696432 RepID=A0A6B9WUR8_9CAUD|nr:hypothetical protein JR324_gp164 [Escherichia phage nieznany]QHR69497.1 hypothetical protein nieznany_164 [Escherichia phage nieznany]HBC8515963.1 hypothetical protein [Escherichia coli]
MAGYHITNIKKQPYGSIEKIKEEVEELFDAVEQDCKIMQLVELSDIIGAVEGVLEQQFPGTTLQDLIIMSNITKRAFRTGGRS